MAAADEDGTGLTLKQLVLEIRQDVRWLRSAIDNKVEKTEFLLLKERFERVMSGEVTTAYAKAMMDEYEKLKTSVKQLEKDREQVTIAKEIADKTTAATASNRRWIWGLVVATVIQIANVIYNASQGRP